MMNYTPVDDGIRLPAGWPTNPDRDWSPEELAVHVASEHRDSAPMLTVDSMSLAPMLDAALMTLTRYVHFASDEQAWACALWAAHTWAVNEFDVSPRLAIRAATKGSGKTRLLEVLAKLCRSSWHILTPSAAVLYHYIEDSQPTVLLDEADRLFQARDEDTAALVAVINGGAAQGTTVPRMDGVGKSMKVRNFNVFGPLALAGIGTKWPDTVLDRSIVIDMQKRNDDEPIERFPLAVRWAPESVGEELGKWVLRAVEAGLPKPGTLPMLTDRQEDTWRPLIAIGAAASTTWTQRALDAAVKLSQFHSVLMAEDDRDEVQALGDMVAIFEREDPPSGFMGSTELTGFLVALDDRPWADWHNKGLTTHGLARMMKVVGVRPTNPFGSNKRGYVREQVETVWKRLGPKREHYG